MATTAAPQPAQARRTATNDRMFYSGMAVLMALTVLAGFSSTYYLRLVSGTPVTLSGGPVTTLFHLHGAAFTGWVVLFVLQTSLIATRRVALHRRLGLASIALAITMVIVGFKTAVASAARGAAPPGVEPLAFLVVPMFDLVLFSGFVTAALLQRRQKEAHKRLMLLAYVSIITAAIARLPGILALGPLVFFGLSLLFVVFGILYDRVTRGTIHRVYLWGGAILALSVPLRLAISSTTAWQSFAAWLVR